MQAFSRVHIQNVSWLARELAARHRDWRAWTFRSHRLVLNVATPLTGSYEFYDKPRPNGGWEIE